MIPNRQGVSHGGPSPSRDIEHAIREVRGESHGGLGHRAGENIQLCQKQQRGH